MTVTPLVSVDRAKQHLNMAADEDPASDAEIYDFTAAATEIINKRCGITAPTSFTETVYGRADASGRVAVVLSKTPVMSVQSVTSQLQGFVVNYDTTALLIDGEAGLLRFSNWWAFYGPVTVAYTAGRSDIPQALQTACLILTKWLWETQRGGAVAVPGAGGDEYAPDDGGMPYRAVQLMDEAPYFAAPGIA